MSNNSGSLVNKLSSELLFFAWLELKKNCIYSSELSSTMFIYPISRTWFIKVPLLFKSGKLNLKKRNLLISTYCCRNNYSNFLKTQVFEYAFILILQPFFKNLFFCKIYKRAEYLWLLVNDVYFYSFNL